MCLESGQPHIAGLKDLVGALSPVNQEGLKKTFIKIYIVERTNKAETRPEEESEKVESCRENLCNKIQVKGL